jgi:hypothetical protein
MHLLYALNVSPDVVADMQNDRFISNRGATNRGNNVLERVNTGGSVRISL